MKGEAVDDVVSEQAFRLRFWKLGADDAGASGNSLPVALENYSAVLTSLHDGTIIERKL